MTMKKNRVPKLVAVAAMMLLPLLQTLSAGGGHGPQIELTYTKWLLSGVNYTGEVGGDIDGVLTTKVLSFVPPDPLPADNDIRQLEAEFKILAGAQSFTALLSGHQNNGTRTGVLNGIVTEGFHEGARVHVEFDFTVAEGPGPFTECPRRVCYAGTIRVMPN
jgi:hypothetical protein